MINAGYMPLAIYVYFKYSRPNKPGASARTMPAKQNAEDGTAGMETSRPSPSNSSPSKPMSAGKQSGTLQHQHMANADHSDITGNVEFGSPTMAEHHDVGEKMAGMQHGGMPEGHAMMHAPKPGQPMWATVAMGVAHCGGGCVLGDLVGEWLVWGTGATIRGRDLWPCLLIDFVFALLFGIAFQYFSIAPMTGEWGPKTMWRAAKADFLSLVFFEVGLFGWMVIFEVAIWNYMLEMNTWTYWWMMQVSWTGTCH
jgi:hypothetical protein